MWCSYGIHLESKARAAADQNRYRTGLKVDDAEMKQFLLTKDDFIGNWNYFFTSHPTWST